MKKIALLLLCFFFCTVCFSQTDEEMTPYELAREKLAKETMLKLFESMSVGEQISMSLAFAEIEKKCEDRYDEIVALEEIIYTACGLSELFKTEANYWYESNVIKSKSEADQIQSWSAIGKEYSDKRKKVEEKKTTEDVEREKTRIKQKSGVFALYKKINKKFSEWATKGEIEKTVDYNNRMESSAISVFDSICYTCLCDELKENYRIKIVGYDADEEICKITWEVIGKNRETLASKEGLFHVSPENYLNLKRTENITGQNPSSVGIVNDYIIPNKIQVLGYKVEFSDEGDLAISSNILKDAENQKFLVNHIFKCSEYVSRFVLKDDLAETLNNITQKIIAAYQIKDNESFGKRAKSVEEIIAAYQIKDNESSFNYESFLGHKLYEKTYTKEKAEEMELQLKEALAYRVYKRAIKSLSQSISFNSEEEVIPFNQELCDTILSGNTDVLNKIIIEYRQAHHNPANNQLKSGYAHANQRTSKNEKSNDTQNGNVIFSLISVISGIVLIVYLLKNKI